MRSPLARGEVRAQADDRVDAAREQRLLGRLHAGHRERREVARALERADEVRGVGARALDHHRHRHVLDVERQAVAEQQQQRDRQDESNRDAARIAHDLEELLAHQAAQAHAASGAHVHAAAPAAPVP